MTEEQLREKILALKRPDSVTAKYIIECELDDLMSLFTHQLELAKIEARLSECQSWKCKNSDNTSAIEKRVAELTKQKNLLTKENK